MLVSHQHPVMAAGLIALVMIVAVASRALELRLWRSGRISDAAAAALVLARFPIVCFLFGLILGTPPPLLVAISVLATIPGVVAYRSTVSHLRGEAYRARAIKASSERR